MPDPVTRPGLAIRSNEAHAQLLAHVRSTVKAARYAARLLLEAKAELPR